eukprot:2063633-Prymnesium_polylepis.1
MAHSSIGWVSSAPRLREPKPLHGTVRNWANFDPYKDNAGCVIRVARRPSSLVAPPTARRIVQQVGDPGRDPLARQAETCAARAAATPPAPPAPLDPKIIEAIAEVTRTYLMNKDGEGEP